MGYIMKTDLLQICETGVNRVRNCSKLKHETYLCNICNKYFLNDI